MHSDSSGQHLNFQMLEKTATHLGCYSCHRVDVVAVAAVVVVVLTHVLSAVPVADIKAVITGKDCPHMKEKGALKQNKVRVRVCVCAYTCIGVCRWVCNQARGCVLVCVRVA